MTLAPGTRLGTYEILSVLGAGGMGEVWRATDTKLGREVAIKVLPEEFFEDRDRVARFEREAKSLAALNHPGIAAIYSFEEISGRHLLVMELVEGEDLAQRLLSGPLPLDGALPVARQIAEALVRLRKVTAGNFNPYPWFVHDPLLEPVRGDASIRAFLEESKRTFDADRRAYASAVSK